MPAPNSPPYRVSPTLKPPLSSTGVRLCRGPVVRGQLLAAVAGAAARAVVVEGVAAVVLTADGCVVVGTVAVLSVDSCAGAEAVVLTVEVSMACWVPPPLVLLPMMMPSNRMATAATPAVIQGQMFRCFLGSCAI